jgi:flagellar protein FlaI
MSEKKKIETYTVVADNVPATINIMESPTENVRLYEVIMPDVGKATEALLDDLKEKLAEKVPLDIQEIIDPKKGEEMKQKFFKETKEIILKNMPDQKENKIEVLAGIMLHKMYGLGFIDVIMADDLLEEVAINGANLPLAIYHKKFGWCKSNISLKNEEEIFILSSQIGRKVGREINSLNLLIVIVFPFVEIGNIVAATLSPLNR